MLFRQQPNAFTSFTVNLGPLYVERVFDRLLTMGGIPNVARMPDADRYSHYLTYLEETVAGSTCKQYPYIQLYTGYFYQQLANQTGMENNRLHFREKALCHYRNYLDLPAIADEGRFYAQWQTGLLQEELGYSWQQAEASLLLAHALDPLRGETVHQIVRHYVQKRQWDIAYQHSFSAVRQYFDHNPIAVRRWFVDFNAYNWNVLHTHLGICYKMGYLGEAKTIYARMLRYELEHLQELNNTEIRHIHSLQRLFHLPKGEMVSVG